MIHFVIDKKAIVGLISLFCSLILSNQTAFSQIYENIYRPSKPDWQQLDTPRFKILFQKGEENAAYQSAHILEEQYPIVQSLVGGTLSNMPVVLNSYNDRSNGYVTTLHFRIEVEIPRTKGKTMNPADGNWLNTVMPHELVHALHLNVLPSDGISGIIRFFSPDVARVMHMAAPLGMIEGIAVFHESHHHYGIGGRGNHPYFTGRHDAIFNSTKKWSLSQNLTDPLHTYPFDRHYMGGYEFINWLQYEYGMEITKKTIRFVSRWPFLGYGTALWYHTGERPSELQKRFESNKSEQVKDRQSTSSETEFRLVGNRDFLQSRRPLFTSENTLLFYSSSDNKRPGFYHHNIDQNNTTLFKETGTVEDYVFSIDPDSSKLLYSRYHRHPFYHNHNRMKVHELSLDLNRSSPADNRDPGTNRTIHDTERVHAAVYGPNNSIWALQTHHETNILLEFTSSSKPDTVLIPDNGHLVELGFHPANDNSLFLLGNRNGMQGLWFLEKDSLSVYNEREPDIAFDQGSIYDPTWHPDGNRLLFTSDIDEAMNLYEYDIDENVIFKLTDHPYGVLEGTYSPDGEKLAAVRINENRHEVFWIEYSELNPVQIDQDKWNNAPFTGPITSASPDPDTISEDWPVSEYKTGLNWLRPRMFLPYYDIDTRSDRSNELGFILASGDILRKNSYYADISYSHDRLWYDIEYRYSGFFPGFRVNTYRKPIETTRRLQQIQGIGFDIPFHYQFDKDTRFSSLHIVPGIDYIRQSHVGDMSNTYLDRLRGTLSVSYQHRLQQNIRDIQPNTGWIFYKQTEWDLHTSHSAHELKAFRAGLYRYLSFNLSGNRSLRLGLEGFTQNLPNFDISGFYSRGFDEYVLSDFNNAGRFNTRYTIPLWHIDNGWTLIPLFLDRIYAVLLSETLVPIHIDNTASQFYHDSRTLFGAGIRFQMRLFNIPFDIGVATVYEPTRNRTAVFGGSF